MAEAKILLTKHDFNDTNTSSGSVTVAGLVCIFDPVNIITANVVSAGHMSLAIILQ